MSAMAQIGAQIEKNKDGSVNTLKTLESIARIFPKFVLTSSRSLMPWG
jgi:hypothetical protein